MKSGRKTLSGGLAILLSFVIWTVLIQTVDVKPEGIFGTNVGFATVNTWFHSLTDVRMMIYTITDWLGLVPIFVCIGFGIVGLYQWMKRRSLWKVDFDIRVLGIYYILVIFE